MTEQPILITSVEASEDLTKNLLIDFNGSLCETGTQVLGVCNADTASGEIAPIALKGIVLVLSGGAISKSSLVQSNADGKAITYAGQNSFGYALDACTGADQIIRVILK